MADRRRFSDEFLRVIRLMETSTELEDSAWNNNSLGRTRESLTTNQVELKFVVLVLCEGGKPQLPKKNPHHNNENPSKILNTHFTLPLEMEPSSQR